MIQGAIFDMDGVLVDNLEFHLEAFQKFGREQGRNLTRGSIQAVFGRKNEDMLKILLGRELNREESDRFADRKEEIYRELIAPHLPDHVVPGLFDFLRELSESGIAAALATSGPMENVDLVLDRLEIRPYFRAVITGNQVSRGKPHPEAFLLAASRLGQAPESCVVFEDSISGIRAALNGGCFCVALSTTHPVSEIEPENPHLIIADFTELSLSCIQNSVNGNQQ